MLVSLEQSNALISTLKQQGDCRMLERIDEIQTREYVSGVKHFKYPPSVSELLETAGQYAEVLIRNSFSDKMEYLLLVAVSDVIITNPSNGNLNFLFRCLLDEYAIGFYRTSFVVECLLSDEKTEKHISGMLTHKLLNTTK